MQGLIHRHLNKRKSQDSDQHGTEGFWIFILDKLTLAAGIIGPLMVIPQIYKIYSSRNAAGVSALSWFAFAFLDIPFIFYGKVHKDKPIIITYIMFFVANLIVGIGAVLYH